MIESMFIAGLIGAGIVLALVGLVVGLIRWYVRR